MEHLNRFYEMLDGLDGPMSAVKKQFGLTQAEWERLGKLAYTRKLADTAQLNSIAAKKNLQRDSWLLQTDSDLSLLSDRIGYCTGIHGMVGEELAERLMSAAIVELSALRFAPVKQYERSSQKLKGE